MKRLVYFCPALLLLFLSVSLFAQDAALEKTRVACIGNSITFGASLANPAKDSYPSVLGQMLGNEYTVRNFGVSGRTLLSLGDFPYMKESAFCRALEFEPDIVIIMLGTNDSKPQNWAHCEDFERDLQTMIDRFSDLESQPRIMLAYPPKAYNIKGGICDSVIVHGVIPRIRRVAAKNGLDIIDMHAVTDGMEENFPDKVHPNPQGQLVLAETAYKAIMGKSIHFASQPFPGVKSRWNGYDRYDFEYNGRDAIVVVPEKPRPGNPWIWRPAFFGAFPSVDIAMLAEGYHVVYYDLAFLYGSPRSQRLGDEFYGAMLKYYGLSPKVVLEGFSRGGLFAVNWSARNPECIACLYLDAPVCNVESWPGRERQDLWQELLVEWNLSESQIADFPGNPIDLLLPLAENRIPIIGVSGDRDRTVPYDENLEVLKNRYERLGGLIEVIVKPGCDHHPHSLENPAQIVDFILEKRLN
ncbi:MAG TPA: hypothetical protein H9879_09595 [Candidatus Alistipes intestinipullorum]|nr:hypothetical protein [Candidatus Alistipes intestinipullorum]